MRLLLDLIRPTAGSATLLGLDSPRAQPRDPAPGRVPAGRPRALPEADRRGDARLPGRAARRRRPTVPRRARRALRRRPRPADPRALDRQPAEARAHPGVHARARAADPRRADRRARPAGPAAASTRCSARSRAQGRTVFLSSHTLSEVERVADRVAILRRGRLVVVDSLEDLREVAVQRLEIEFAGAARASRSSRALPGVREVDVDGRASRRALRGLGRRARQGARRARGARDPQPRRRPRGDLPALLPRRTAAHERAGVQDGAAAAAAHDAALGARHGRGDPHGRGALPGGRATRSASSTFPKGVATCSAAPTTARSPAGCAARSARSTGRCVIAAIGDHGRRRLDRGRGGGRILGADARPPGRRAAPRPRQGCRGRGQRRAGRPRPPSSGSSPASPSAGGGIAVGDTSPRWRCTSRSSAWAVGALALALAASPAGGRWPPGRRRRSPCSASSSTASRRSSTRSTG